MLLTKRPGAKVAIASNWQKCWATTGTPAAWVSTSSARKDDLPTPYSASISWALGRPAVAPSAIAQARTSSNSQERPTKPSRRKLR